MTISDACNITLTKIACLSVVCLYWLNRHILNTPRHTVWVEKQKRCKHEMTVCCYLGKGSYVEVEIVTCVILWSMFNIEDSSMSRVRSGSAIHLSPLCKFWQFVQHFVVLYRAMLIEIKTRKRNNFLLHSIEPLVPDRNNIKRDFY